MGTLSASLSLVLAIDFVQCALKDVPRAPLLPAFLPCCDETDLDDYRESRAFQVLDRGNTVT
jgi:hypothetical protein